MMDTLRKIGVVLLGAALLITWLEWTWVALGALLAVGVIDIVLVVKKEKTISQWIHKLFPKAIDAVIMVGIAAYTWAIWGAAGFLPIVMGIVIGHLFWHDD